MTAHQLGLLFCRGFGLYWMCRGLVITVEAIFMAFDPVFAATGKSVFYVSVWLTQFVVGCALWFLAPRLSYAFLATPSATSGAPAASSAQLKSDDQLPARFDATRLAILVVGCYFVLESFPSLIVQAFRAWHLLDIDTSYGIEPRPSVGELCRLALTTVLGVLGMLGSRRLSRGLG